MNKDKTINRDLLFDASTAINIISNSIEKQEKWWPPDLGLKGLSYQGIITDNHFKIWTREARRGPAPAFVEGDIQALDTQSRIIARIEIIPFCRPFDFSPVIRTLIVLISFISFIFAMIDLVKNTTPIAFPIFMVSIFLVVMILINYKAKQEQKDLEDLINNLFPYQEKN